MYVQIGLIESMRDIVISAPLRRIVGRQIVLQTHTERLSGYDGHCRSWYLAVIGALPYTVAVDDRFLERHFEFNPIFATGRWLGVGRNDRPRSQSHRDRSRGGPDFSA